MADLSHLSDEQVLALATGKGAPQPNPSLSHLSDDDILKLAGGSAAPDMSMGKAALIKGEEGALLGLRPVVSGLGAAAGDAVGQLQGNSPYSLAQTIQAFKEGRSGANEEQKQAQESHPTVSTLADVGGSLLTLPFLPAKGLAGAVGLGAGLGAAQAAGSAESLPEAGADIVGGGALGGAGYGLAKGVGAIASSGIGQKAASKVSNVLQKIALKTPSELTGVADKEIEAYAKRADKVNEIIQDNLAEGKFDSQLAANHMKDNIVNDVARTKRSLNSQISQALNSAPKDEIFSIDPIKQTLTESISKLDPVYDAGQIKKIQGLMETLDKKAPQGRLSIQDLQKTKQYLYDMAEGAYRPSSEFFQIGDDVANAAKRAGRTTLETLDTYGPEEIKNANRQLSQLHDIQDSMGPSLLDKTASASSLFSVGAGSNPRDTLALKNLGGLTGGNYLQDATDLSAARTFASPSLFPNYRTGRSVLGPVIGGSIGGGVGGIIGGGPGAYLGSKIGAGIGAAISSPAALKLALDTGRISGKAIDFLAEKVGLKSNNLQALYEVLQKPQAQEILIRGMADNNNEAAASQEPKSAAARRLINMQHKGGP